MSEGSACQFCGTLVVRGGRECATCGATLGEGQVGTGSSVRAGAPRRFEPPVGSAVHTPEGASAPSSARRPRFGPPEAAAPRTAPTAHPVGQTPRLFEAVPAGQGPSASRAQRGMRGKRTYLTAIVVVSACIIGAVVATRAPACRGDADCKGAQRCWCSRLKGPVGINGCLSPDDLPNGECLSQATARSRAEAEEAQVRRGEHEELVAKIGPEISKSERGEQWRASVAACRSGNAEACFVAGHLTPWSETQVDIEKGTLSYSFFERACELGMRRGCVYAPMRIRRWNPFKAAALMKEQCGRAGDYGQLACFIVAFEEAPPLRGQPRPPVVRDMCSRLEFPGLEAPEIVMVKDLCAQLGLAGDSGFAPGDGGPSVAGVSPPIPAPEPVAAPAATLAPPSQPAHTTSNPRPHRLRSSRGPDIVIHPE